MLFSVFDKKSSDSYEKLRNSSDAPENKCQRKSAIKLKLTNAHSTRTDKMWWILSQALALLALTSSRVECLRLTKMSAPGVVDYRSTLHLECQFDMGGELLYAVKWYKDDHEFFRYQPHQQPHQLLFPVHGVRLANETIDCGTRRCQLTLDHLVRQRSGGAYRCEVSTEAPAFRLISETRNVTVAALPAEGPWIEDLEAHYAEGDILTAKCLSAPSDPPQLITWYINKELAAGKYVRDIKRSKPDENGLASSSLIIRLVVETQKYGKHIDLSCVASFDGVPESARTASKTVALFDHETQIQQHSNPSFTYWYSSTTTVRTDILLVITALGVVVLRTNR
ncbi:uncharacterized protein [Atheta coriaria]|uniref:uncharacterized protein n=1 Tax=Dalotia coriaria TaxID=877792 RepID=UPI0031F39385